MVSLVFTVASVFSYMDLYLNQLLGKLNLRYQTKQSFAKLLNALFINGANIGSLKYLLPISRNLKMSLTSVSPL